MKDKTILITGSTAGIGKQTAISLAEKGYQVIITGRNKESGEKVVSEIKQLTNNQKIGLILADISTIAGIIKINAEFKSSYSNLDCLINNAGSASKSLTITPDGFELNFAVNVIAPYLLSTLLLDNLKLSPEPRIITLAGGDLPQSIDLSNLQNERYFDGLNSYSQSKVAMMCIMYELSKKLRDTKITCNICYPGQASTSMTQNVTKEMLPKFMRPIYPIFKLAVRPDNGKSAKKASKSSIYLATSADVTGKSGLYVNKKIKIKQFPKIVMDDNSRKILWDYMIEKLSTKEYKHQNA